MQNNPQSEGGDASATSELAEEEANGNDTEEEVVDDIFDFDEMEDMIVVDEVDEVIGSCDEEEKRGVSKTRAKCDRENSAKRKSSGSSGFSTKRKSSDSVESSSKRKSSGSSECSSKNLKPVASEDSSETSKNPEQGEAESMVVEECPPAENSSVTSKNLEESEAENMVVEECPSSQASNETSINPKKGEEENTVADERLSTEDTNETSSDLKQGEENKTILEECSSSENSNETSSNLKQDEEKKTMVEECPASKDSNEKLSEEKHSVFSDSPSKNHGHDEKNSPTTEKCPSSEDSIKKSSEQEHSASLESLTENHDQDEEKNTTAEKCPSSEDSNEKSSEQKHSVSSESSTKNHGQEEEKSSTAEKCPSSKDSNENSLEPEHSVSSESSSKNHDHDIEKSITAEKCPSSKDSSEKSSERKHSASSESSSKNHNHDDEKTTTVEKCPSSEDSSEKSSERKHSVSSESSSKNHDHDIEKSITAEKCPSSKDSNEKSSERKHSASSESSSKNHNHDNEKSTTAEKCPSSKDSNEKSSERKHSVSSESSTKDHEHKEETTSAEKCPTSEDSNKKSTKRKNSVSSESKNGSKSSRESKDKNVSPLLLKASTQTTKKKSLVLKIPRVCIPRIDLEAYLQGKGGLKVNVPKWWPVYDKTVKSTSKHESSAKEKEEKKIAEPVKKVSKESKNESTNSHKKEKKVVADFKKESSKGSKENKKERTSQEKGKKIEEKIEKKTEERIEKKTEEKIEKKTEEKTEKKTEEKIDKRTEEKIEKKIDKKTTDSPKSNKKKETIQNFKIPRLKRDQNLENNRKEKKLKTFDSGQGEDSRFTAIMEHGTQNSRRNVDSWDSKAKAPPCLDFSALKAKASPTLDFSALKTKTPPTHDSSASKMKTPFTHDSFSSKTKTPPVHDSSSSRIQTQTTHDSSASEIQTQPNQDSRKRKFGFENHRNENRQIEWVNTDDWVDEEVFANRNRYGGKKRRSDDPNEWKSENFDRTHPRNSSYAHKHENSFENRAYRGNIEERNRQKDSTSRDFSQVPSLSEEDRRRKETDSRDSTSERGFDEKRKEIESKRNDHEQMKSPEKREHVTKISVPESGPVKADDAGKVMNRDAVIVPETSSFVEKPSTPAIAKVNEPKSCGIGNEREEQNDLTGRGGEHDLHSEALDLLEQNWCQANAVAVPSHVKRRIEMNLTARQQIMNANVITNKSHEDRGDRNTRFAKDPKMKESYETISREETGSKPVDRKDVSNSGRPDELGAGDRSGSFENKLRHENSRDWHGRNANASSNRDPHNWRREQTVDDRNSGNEIPADANQERRKKTRWEPADPRPFGPTQAENSSIPSASSANNANRTSFDENKSNDEVIEVIAIANVNEAVKENSTNENRALPVLEKEQKNDENKENEKVPKVLPWLVERLAESRDTGFNDATTNRNESASAIEVIGTMRGVDVIGNFAVSSSVAEVETRVAARRNENQTNNESSKDLTIDLTESEVCKDLPLLEEYRKAVRYDPTDFTAWTQLLRHVEQGSHIPITCEVYDDFLSKYPYCYGYWRKYGDYLRKHGKKDECEAVFERGVQAIPLSVDLWLHYLDYTRETYLEDEDRLRQLFERSVKVCGLEFRSDTLWETYIKWETDKGHTQNVTKILDRWLQVPSRAYMTVMDKFREHVESHSPQDILGLEDFLLLRLLIEGKKKSLGSDLTSAERKVMKQKIINARKEWHAQTQKAASDRWSFEENIKRPYFHVQPLDNDQLENWRRYLDFEIKEGDEERVTVLFERCLIACASYEEFWIKFTDYLLSLPEKDVKKVREVFVRACTIHHPKKLKIHLKWAQFEQAHGDPLRAPPILEKMEKLCPNVLMLMIRRINLLRLRGEFELVSALYEQYIEGRKDASATSSLGIKYASLCNQIFNNIQKAYDILQDIVKKDKTKSLGLSRTSSHFEYRWFFVCSFGHCHAIYRSIQAKYWDERQSYEAGEFVITDEQPGGPRISVNAASEMKRIKVEDDSCDINQCLIMAGKQNYDELIPVSGTTSIETSSLTNPVMISEMMTRPEQAPRSSQACVGAPMSKSDQLIEHQKAQILRFLSTLEMVKSRQADGEARKVPPVLESYAPSEPSANFVPNQPVPRPVPPVIPQPVPQPVPPVMRPPPVPPMIPQPVPPVVQRPVPPVVQQPVPSAMAHLNLIPQVVQQRMMQPMSHVMPQRMPQQAIPQAMPAIMLPGMSQARPTTVFEGMPHAGSPAMLPAGMAPARPGIPEAMLPAMSQRMPQAGFPSTHYDNFGGNRPHNLNPNSLNRNANIEAPSMAATGLPSNWDSDYGVVEDWRPLHPMFISLPTVVHEKSRRRHNRLCYFERVVPEIRITVNRIENISAILDIAIDNSLIPREFYEKHKSSFVGFQIPNGRETPRETRVPWRKNQVCVHREQIKGQMFYSAKHQNDFNMMYFNGFFVVNELTDVDHIILGWDTICDRRPRYSNTLNAILLDDHDNYQQIIRVHRWHRVTDLISLPEDGPPAINPAIRFRFFDVKYDENGVERYNAKQVEITDGKPVCDNPGRLHSNDIELHKLRQENADRARRIAHLKL